MREYVREHWHRVSSITVDCIVLVEHIIEVVVVMLRRLFGAWQVLANHTPNRQVVNVHLVPIALFHSADQRFCFLWFQFHCAIQCLALIHSKLQRNPRIYQVIALCLFIIISMHDKVVTIA